MNDSVPTPFPRLPGDDRGINRALNDHLRQVVNTRAVDLIETQRVLVDRMNAGFARYDGRPLRTALSPWIFSGIQWRELQRFASRLTEIQRTLIGMYREHDVLRSILDLPATVDDLIRSRPPFQDPLPIARVDTFWTASGYRILEFNTDSSSGMNDAPEIEEGLLESDLYREILTRWPLRVNRMNHRVYMAILDSYRFWPGRRRERPTIAIVDWKGVGTEPEFLALKAEFERFGSPTLLADPGDLHIDGDRLIAGDQPVDTVYRRALTFELVAKPEAAAPLFEAYRRGLICPIGSFEGEVLYSKLSLAALTDPRVQDDLPEHMLEFIRATCPWTRRLEDGPSKSGEGSESLLEIVRRDKDQLVIKPATAYGGNGVVLGFKVTSSEWDLAIENALKSACVIQELVSIPELPALLVVGGQIEWRDLKANLGIFTFGGSFGGVYLRASEDPVINVSAGGATIPTFRVE